MADSGPAALAELWHAVTRGEPFRVMLLDRMMPDMDGFDLADRVKNEPALSDTTLIMLTSAAEPDESRARELGIAQCLTKPVKQSDLLDAIVHSLDVAEAEPPAEEAERVRQQPPALRTMQVLLAEDSLVNQKVAVRLLELRGHTVTVAGNGREAVTAVKEGAEPRFDLVLMDVQMPEMDGYEATAAIRLHERATGRHLPIVAMTANAMKGDRERCLAAGMDGYIAKPIRARELYEIVESITAEVDGGHAVPGVAPSSAEPLDRAEALERTGGSVEVLQELVELFFEECPKLMDQIRHAIARGEAPELRRAAHTLKGSVSVFGAEPAREAAWRLESMGREGNLSQAETAWAALENEIERLKPALRSLE